MSLTRASAILLNTEVAKSINDQANHYCLSITDYLDRIVSIDRKKPLLDEQLEDMVENPIEEKRLYPEDLVFSSPKKKRRITFVSRFNKEEVEKIKQRLSKFSNPFLNTNQISEILGIEKDNVRALNERNKLKSFQFCKKGKYYTKQSDLLNFIDDHIEKSTSYLSLEQVASRLGFSTFAILYRVRKGLIKGYQFGTSKDFFFKPSDVEKLKAKKIKKFVNFGTEEETYSTKELAKLFNVRIKTIIQMIKGGLLIASKNKYGHWVCNRSHIQDVLEKTVAKPQVQASSQSL